MAPTFAFLLTALAIAAPSQRAIDDQLIKAVRDADVKVVKTLLARGANPNAREQLTTLTSLHEKTVGGRKYSGDSVLIIAINTLGNNEQRAAGPKNSWAIFDTLLAAKANVNGRGLDRSTPLICAAGFGETAIVEKLLARGAKPNLQDKVGDTALVACAYLNDPETMEALLDKGADINGGTGWTPLMRASWSGYFDPVKFLLARGANPNIRRKGCMTALEYARASGSSQIEKILLKHKAKGRSSEELQMAAKAVIAKTPARLPRSATALDAMVIQAALREMMDSGERDNPFDVRVKELMLETVAIGEFDTQDEAHMNYSAREHANSITLEMRRSLEKQNNRPANLIGLAFSDPRIRVVKESEIDKVFSPISGPKNVGFAAIQTMPGYSKDGRSAVLTLSFGPTSHGAEAVLFLEKSQSGWKVKWKEYVFYA